MLPFLFFNHFKVLNRELRCKKSTKCGIMKKRKGEKNEEKIRRGSN